MPTIVSTSQLWYYTGFSVTFDHLVAYIKSVFHNVVFTTTEAVGLCTEQRVKPFSEASFRRRESIAAFAGL